MSFIAVLQYHLRGIIVTLQPGKIVSFQTALEDLMEHSFYWVVTFWSSKFRLGRNMLYFAYLH